MNTLRSFTLTLLLACASVHAMEDVRIVPFDELTHGAQAKALFKNTQLAYPAYLASKTISDSMKVTVEVLLINDIVLGLAGYYDTQNPYKTTVMRNLDVLIIDQKYRNKPEHLGTIFMQKFEEKTLKEGITIIKLPVPLSSAAAFYEKIGYNRMPPRYFQMQKQLNPTDQ